MGWDFQGKKKTSGTKKCTHCNKPILTEASMHRWCRRHYVTEETERLLPSHAQPIRPMEVPMPKAQPKTAQLPVTPASLTQAGLEFLELKAEQERITMLLEKRKAFLKTELAKLSVPELVVGDEVLYLCPTESKSFDLDKARETLNPAALKKLEPFIKVTETFELKSAEPLIDMDKYAKFISVRTSIQLRTRNLKDEE